MCFSTFFIACVLRDEYERDYIFPCNPIVGWYDDGYVWFDYASMGEDNYAVLEAIAGYCDSFRVNPL